VAHCDFVQVLQRQVGRDCALHLHDARTAKGGHLTFTGQRSVSFDVARQLSTLWRTSTGGSHNSCFCKNWYSSSLGSSPPPFLDRPSRFNADVTDHRSNVRSARSRTLDIGTARAGPHHLHQFQIDFCDVDRPTRVPNEHQLFGNRSTNPVLT
jgi:hypothetical protein